MRRGTAGRAFTRVCAAGAMAAGLSAGPWAITAHAGDRIDRVVAGLRSTPVFVDPSCSGLLNAAQRADADTLIRAARFPIYVVVVPMSDSDESGGDSSIFAYDLYERWKRPGEYVIVDSDGDATTVDADVPVDTIELNVDLLAGDSPIGRRLPAILTAIERSPSASPSPPDDPGTPEPYYSGLGDPNRPDRAAAFAGGVAAGGLAIPAVLAFVWFLLARPLWRMARRAATGGAAGGGRGKPGRHALARLADAEIRRLRAALDRGPDNDGRARALSALDAASLLRTDDAGPATLLAVTLLARDGLAALAGETPVPPLFCFVDPLRHGPAATAHAVALPGLPTASHPLCARCRHSATASRRRSVLRLAGGTPYYATPGPWRDGHLTGNEPDLPQRIREYLGVTD